MPEELSDNEQIADRLAARWAKPVEYTQAAFEIVYALDEAEQRGYERAQPLSLRSLVPAQCRTAGGEELKFRIYKKRKSRIEKLNALQVKRDKTVYDDIDDVPYPDEAFWHALRLYREANTWHYNKFRRNPTCPPL